MNDRIIKLNHSDICWPFDGKPYLLLNTEPYKRQECIDPFPCYSHDVEYVNELVAQFESKVNLKFKPKYFIMPFECESRTNGYHCGNEQYGGEKDAPKELKPYIVFHGKRIPIMPSMSRYLVSHELSHCVESNICAIMGKDTDEFCKDYAKIREVEKSKSYGGLFWHKAVSEIMANDIRILFFNAEPEFWPHEVNRPTQNKVVQDFWADMKQKYLS